jgi:hypothetical protein
MMKTLSNAELGLDKFDAVDTASMHEDESFSNDEQSVFSTTTTVSSASSEDEKSIRGNDGLFPGRLAPPLNTKRSYTRLKQLHHDS